MQIFLVSIRTAQIYGPGQITLLEQLTEAQVRLQAHWPFIGELDEWEGYALVVPERKQVWGVCKPAVSEQLLSIDSMMFTPKPIPPKELAFFHLPSPRPEAADDSVETDSEAD
ncbi:MAG: hypothetical protein IGS03_11275 [Candidatus Sericytochromatia bacterium]|nr:hypothetical protein [Candidatus Sericytochromatia bacterium]